MPHFIVEYSANIREEIDSAELFRKLRDAAVETGIFPLGGIRFRAVCCEEYLVADGDPANAFVHMTAKIGHGRPLEVRRDAAEKLFSVLTDHLQPLFDSRPLAISFELAELHPDLSFKQNNIHQRLNSARD
jgi:5-carboxymethyl-2-hydroxymuconate isomerase